jgi:hypothetical protein
MRAMANRPPEIKKPWRFRSRAETLISVLNSKDLESASFAANNDLVAAHSLRPGNGDRNQALKFTHNALVLLYTMVLNNWREVKLPDKQLASNQRGTT